MKTKVSLFSSDQMSNSKLYQPHNMDLIQHLVAKQEPEVLLFNETPKHFWEKWFNGKDDKNETEEEQEQEMSNGDDHWWGIRRPG